MFVDRTHSKVGQQYLYQKLRAIPNSSNTVNEKLVERFSTDENFRIATQILLDKLKSNEAAYITALFQEEHLKPPKWFFITRILSFTSLLSIVLMIFNPVMVFVLLGVFPINIFIHFWNKRNLNQYIVSIPQLLRLVNVANELFKKHAFKEINPEVLKSLETMSGIKNRMLFFRLESKIDNDMAALVWGLIETFKIIFLIEPLFLFGVLKQLDTKRKEIENIFSFVGEIDMLISIASLRSGLSMFCKPTISETQKIVTGA